MAMLLDINQFNKALSTWMESDIIPQYDGLKRIAATVVGAMVTRNSTKMFEQNKHLLATFDIVTPEGWINGDELIAVLHSIFEHQEKLPLGGLIYSEADLERLHEIMKQYAISESMSNGNNNGNSNNGNSLNGNTNNGYSALNNRVMNIASKK